MNARCGSALTLHQFLDIDAEAFGDPGKDKYRQVAHAALDSTEISLMYIGACSQLFLRQWRCL